MYVIPIWVLTTEIGLLLYMRDSGILVVIMLICPVEVLIIKTSKIKSS